MALPPQAVVRTLRVDVYKVLSQSPAFSKRIPHVKESTSTHWGRNQVTMRENSESLGQDQPEDETPRAVQPLPPGGSPVCGQVCFPRKTSSEPGVQAF